MGGVRDVIVLLANSWIRLYISGLKFTSGIFYVALLQEFQLTSGVTSWITTLQYFVNAMTCAVGGILVRRYGSRLTTMAGGTIMFLGMLTSGFATHISHVFITFGVVAGIGSGLTYIGSFEALKVSFTKHRNLAFGFGGFISSMGVVIYPPLLQYLIDTLYWRGMFQVMAALYLNIVVTAYLFPGREEAAPEDEVDVISDILTDIIVTERFVEYEPGDELRVYEVDVGVQDDFSDTSSSQASSETQEVRSIKLSAEHTNGDDIPEMKSEKNQLKDNAPGKSTDEDNKPEKSLEEDDTPEKSTPGDNAPKKSTDEDNTPEKSTPGDNSPEKSAPEDNSPEKSTDEDNTPEKSTDEGKSTPEDNTPEKSTPEDNTPGKSTDEKNTPEKNTYETLDIGKNDTGDGFRNYDTVEIIKTKFDDDEVGVYNVAFEDIDETATQDHHVAFDANHHRNVIAASNRTFKRIAKDKSRRRSSVMEIEVIKHPSSKKKKWYKRLHGSLENSKGYYMFVLSGIISLFGGSILTGHLSAHILDYYNTDTFTASMSYTAFGVSAAVGKLLHGFLATNNRVNPAFLYIGFGILAGLMTFVFLFDISLVVLYGYVVLFSICYASRGGAVLPAMMIRLAGEDNFALALGVYSLVTAVGYLVGAPIAGWIFDDTHSYKWPFVMSAISLTSSSLILLVPCGWKTRS